MMLIILALMPATILGECLVESNMCTFPFQVDDEYQYGCVQEDENSDSYYCKVQLGARYVTGLCNGGCFDDKTGEALEFNSTLDDALSFFCKTSTSPCKFPFIWNDVEYTECTMDGDVDFHWCALEVDSENRLLNNKWGKCDMNTCTVSSGEEEVPEPQQITVHFSQFSGEVVLAQSAPGEDLTFSGHLEGLPDGKLELAVVPSKCDQSHDIDSITTVQALSGSDISSSSWSMSIFQQEDNSIRGHSLLVKERDEDLLDEHGGLQQGKVLDCSPIQESEGGLSMTYIIIIILAVVVAVLILTLCVIICCCCRRKRSEKNYKTSCSIDDDDTEPMTNGNGKIPLYDELSIPFIDASLPPTPKMGRSSDQLAILLGKGSRSSLSKEEA